MSQKHVLSYMKLFQKTLKLILIMESIVMKRNSCCDYTMYHTPDSPLSLWFLPIFTWYRLHLFRVEEEFRWAMNHYIWVILRLFLQWKKFRNQTSIFLFKLMNIKEARELNMKWDKVELSADLFLNRAANFLRPFFQNLRVAAFQQQPRLRFRAGVTQQHPPAVRLSIPLRPAATSLITPSSCSNGFFSRTMMLVDQLRKTRPASRQFRKRLVFCAS